MKKRLNKKGFTLVELLAVIVVLAIVMLIATRAVTRQMNESKGAALMTQAQALQRDLNNRCMLNGGLTKAEAEKIAKEDKIFAKSTGTISATITGTKAFKGNVKIPLSGTKFSNIIAPENPDTTITIDGTASGTVGTISNGTLNITFNCEEN